MDYKGTVLHETEKKLKKIIKVCTGRRELHQIDFKHIYQIMVKICKQDF